MSRSAALRDCLGRGGAFDPWGAKRHPLADRWQMDGPGVGGASELPE